jgi:hypothetical protein
MEINDTSGRKPDPDKMEAFENLPKDILQSLTKEGGNYNHRNTSLKTGIEVFR